MDGEIVLIIVGESAILVTLIVHALKTNYKMGELVAESRNHGEHIKENGEHIKKMCKEISVIYGHINQMYRNRRK